MTEKNPDDRAKELHDLIEDERKKRHTTTAVGNTTAQISIVGTNEAYMRLEIREALFEHEVIARSKIGNHAEENVMDEAAERNLILIEIGASRPICLDCEEKIKTKGIKTRTEYSGKVSQNRRNQ
jgi:hypothetical protein